MTNYTNQNLSDQQYRAEFLLIASRYGFRKDNDVPDYKITMLLNHTSCYLRYCMFNNRVDVTVCGDTVDPSKESEISYFLTDKRDIRKLCTRLRSHAKKAKVLEKESEGKYQHDLERYKEIHQALVDEKVVFGTAITKYEYGPEAVIKVNGYKLTIGNTNLMIPISIGNAYISVHITKAIELCNQLPLKE